MRTNLVVISFLALLICTVSSAQTTASPDGTDSSVSVPQVPPPTPSEQAKVEQDLKDVHFDFDRFDLLPGERATLESDAEWLKSHPDEFVMIEGDADERGDIVYNVALSDKRATTARDALVSMGVPTDRVVFATGWGKLYPVCSGSDESCWSQNRRAHFELWGESNQSEAALGFPTNFQP